MVEGKAEIDMLLGVRGRSEGNCGDDSNVSEISERGRGDVASSLSGDPYASSKSRSILERTTGLTVSIETRDGRD